MRRREFRLARTAMTAAMIIVVAAAGGANRNDVVQAQRLASVKVTIQVDGAKRQVRTAQTTVGATLKDAGVELGPQDMVSVAENERPYDGMKITVTRVRREEQTVVEPIAFETVKSFSKQIQPGKVSETRVGEPGEKRIRYSVRYEDGRAVSKTLLGSEITKKPVSRLVIIGSRGRYTSRGSFQTHRTLSMVATAYDPGPRSCGPRATGRTACGLRAGYGVVAVDPRIIPLGTHLYIEGYGHALAGDRGRAIKGQRIDLGFATYREAKSFGRRRVTVHVLRPQS